MRFKYVVVGAGISGITAAERLAQTGDKVLIVEKRRHIGGNCYDFYNSDGLLVHKYGPHIFHTNYKDVWDYLNLFTDFDLYQHRVLTYVDGMLMPMPICARTINMLFGTSFTYKEAADFLASLAEPRDVSNSEDVVISKAGREIYEKFFREYTKKQWDMYPDELDPSVISRVPVRANGDERYFTDRYQGLPRGGYTLMMQHMLDNPNISVMLNTDYKDVIDGITFDKLIFTGPVDSYFNYSLGRLKYRSVKIETETLDGDYQPAAVVNYPLDYDFTRITEYKKLTGQHSDRTVISREYPSWEGEPYYPVPTAEQKNLAAQYALLAQKEPNTLFLGRLGLYRYLNIDTAVKYALDLCNSLT